MVHRGEADIAVSKISITEQKSIVVGFSYPYNIETLTFATRAPGAIPKTSAIFYPFSFQTWICLAFLLIAIPMLFCKFLKKKYSIVSLAFRVYGILLHQELLLKVRAVSDKLLLGSWLWGAMILSLCYTTLLLSFLTVPVKEKGVQTIDELAAAASRGRYKCMTYQGSSSMWILQNSKTDSVRSIGESILKNNGLIKLNGGV
ncbi:Glutamate receptor, ionotropic kainate 4, partial [Stegodyphus mimosarum]